MNKVYMGGGELRSDSEAAFCTTAIDFVSSFSVTLAVNSNGAFNAHAMMTTTSRRQKSHAWC